MRSLALALILLAQQGKPAPQQPAKKIRTKAEVEALVEKEGKTPPVWWTKVKANPPKTLDLAWPKNPGGPWDPSKNIGQYIWSVINENPSRWQEGVKFMHDLMAMYRDKPELLKRAMNSAGRMYHNLLEDYARAAFWWRKAQAIQEDGEDVTLELADCYWKLGCKEMAVELIQECNGDNTRHASLIKLWCDMGELEKALPMADQRGDDAALLAAADGCRLAGRFDDAIKYYEKAIEVARSDRDGPRNRNRAEASLQAVKLFDALDVKKVAPGKYKADSLGYEAPVEVEVVVGGGKIASVKVTNHKEKQFYSSLTDTPARILARQHVKGVDATTGATITSEAIINAAAKALNQGMPKKK
jgi:uncharacterized protein with FMN-binding domain